jgi:oxygen-independent coproporphyrinogen-3 oxidase
MKETLPYPNKCYLPFILYPPSMFRNSEGSDFLKNNINLDVNGDDFVMYISVPFCRVRCKGCPYFVSILNEEDINGREEQYIQALITDIKRWSNFKRWKTGLLRSIYLGGGTGSILKTENIKRIVDVIFENYNIAEDYEFTLEGNARDFTEEKIEYVANSKINRLSLGVQSFQPEILKIVGSPHEAQKSIEVITKFQEKGMHNIQMDLMYNMPGHTMDIWKRDLEILSSLNIPHFTIYLYRIHTDTPQDLLIKKGKVNKPASPETYMVKEMYKTALNMAKDMGYSMYMVDHFCKPGYENKYNHFNFNVDTDTLGIGPGSYSFFGDYRLGTENDINKYMEYVNNDEFLISTVSIKLSDRVLRERYIVFALLYYKIDFSFYLNKFGTHIYEDFAEEIARLQAKGLLELHDAYIKLTHLGIEWHINIILEFFNDIFWEDTAALNQPHWSLNGIGVEVSAHTREYWLGHKSQVWFDQLQHSS